MSGVWGAPALAGWVLALCAALPVLAEEVILLPSEKSARLHEVIGAGEAEIRLRYVADGFRPARVAPEVLLDDMTYFCQRAILTEAGASAQRVIISLADRAAPFGEFDPEVQQIFEAFRITDGICIWEIF